MIKLDWEKISIGVDGKMLSNTLPAVVAQLQRPVQLLSADLNKDGKEDLVHVNLVFLRGLLLGLKIKAQVNMTDTY